MDNKLHVLSKIIEEEKCALLALDGFLLVLNGDGDITFVTENICEYLGLAKVKKKKNLENIFIKNPFFCRSICWDNPFGNTHTLAITMSFENC